MDMATHSDNDPGVRIPGNRQGGDMVPVSPRSGLRAESCEGPQPGGELPAGSQPGNVTAESEREDILGRSMVDRYLKKDDPGAPCSSQSGGELEFK